MAQWVKNLPAIQERQEAWVPSLGHEDPIQEEMASHASILPEKTSRHRKLVDWTTIQRILKSQMTTEWLRIHDISLELLKLFIGRCFQVIICMLVFPYTNINLFSVVGYQWLLCVLHSLETTLAWVCNFTIKWSEASVVDNVQRKERLKSGEHFHQESFWALLFTAENGILEFDIQLR